MAKDVYEPEVTEETPFPTDTQEGIIVSDSNTKESFSPTEIKGASFPRKRVAVELISTALNTRSKRIMQNFEFSKTGAIQIGDFKEDEYGEIKISPNGIVGKDTSGITTFALDGTDGSLVLKGSLQAGSVITGLITVGNNSVIIDGENKQIIVNDGSNDRVLIGYQENGF